MVMYKASFVARGVALVAMLAVTSLAMAAEVPAVNEADLIETLRTASPAEKALACKQLSIHGSAECVPELAKLLADSQLASWARIALEAIPDPSVDAALIEAARSLEGRLLVGTVNSIGVRRSADATGDLTALLGVDDAEVASAAAVALGRIGNDAATEALRKALAGAKSDVRSAVAEGCILCAERCVSEGRLAEAIEIYDEVRRADVPKPRKLEATRGAILARAGDGGDGAVDLLVEQLDSEDKQFFRLGLAVARELPGDGVAEALAAHLPEMAPEHAGLTLIALSERTPAVLSPAILAAARQGDARVRLAAVGAVGRLGGGEHVAVLLEIAGEDDAELAAAARAALAALPGDGVAEAIKQRLADADGPALAALIQVIGERRIEATDALVKALSHADEAIRAAALKALGATVGPQDLGILIDRLVASEGADADAARSALETAAIRMPDGDAAARVIAAAIAQASPENKARLLRVLGAVGSGQALEAIAKAARGGDAALQDVATRVLGEWMTVDAAPALLELATDPANERFQVRALRGYLRIARQFRLSDAERAEMCAKALAAAKRPQERQLILEILERYPSVATLAVAVDARDEPGLGEAAANTARAIAAKLGESSADVQELLNQLGAVQ
jgi:HEAT repeat protein